MFDLQSVAGMAGGGAMMPINVSDASPTSSTATADLGGGVTFGSMGSGKHTTQTGAAVPSWVWPVVAVVGVLFLLKKGR